jgi:hypothetical protein
MEERDRKLPTQWHILFNDLCEGAGYHDDSSLASAYCTLTASRHQRQFETAVRNLNNWRSGRHLPRSANLTVLARLLKVADDPELQQLWNTLYQRAKTAEAISANGKTLPIDVHESEIVAQEDYGHTALLPRHAPPRIASGLPDKNAKRFSLPHLIAGCVTTLIVGAAIGSTVTASGWRPWSGPADNTPVIPFTPLITMRVGDSRPIHAERGDCGKLPRDWEQVVSSLPAMRTGTFSDGGLARRHSKFCKGLTPARAIVFTADRPGVDEFEIQGDFFKLTVIE